MSVKPTYGKHPAYDKPTHRVYKSSLNCKQEMFRGRYEACEGLVNCLNGSYIDENGFEWDLWLEEIVE